MSADGTVTTGIPAPQVREQLHRLGGRRAYAVWLVALSVYILGIFHRTSLGVAGLIAADRFHIGASQLATFTVVQLLVYAAMQIPVGVLLDRFGSRRLLLAGLAMMTVGQFGFAFASTFQLGVGARVLVGAGDAMIFVSVLRVVTLWFRPTQTPLVTQLTGQLGQIGAIAASFPLAAALSGIGWTPTFLVASGLGVLLAIALLLIVKDAPFDRGAVAPLQLRVVTDSLRATWDTPGTRLGLWTHFTAQFSFTVFALLWGYPFLVAGEGLSPAAASALLVLITATGMVSGPIVGGYVARVPIRRTNLVLTIVGLIAGVWAVVLLWPGRAPLPLLVVLVIVMALGGPGSMIAFDLARTHNPHARMGSALGVVNVGGFIASLLTMALIGVVLDHRAPGGASTYTLDDFRMAMSVQFLFWGVGGLQIWRHRRRTLSHLEVHNPAGLAALQAGDTMLPGVNAAADGAAR